jgi:hypothetical protein
MMPNEGSVPVEATLTNVMATPGQDYGAVEVDTTSEIFIPETPAVTGIVSLEAWFRVDVDPAAGERMGILDTGSTGADPHMSMFYYREQAGIHVLRCEIAKQQLYAPFNAHVGTWAYAACVCADGKLRAFGNGQLLAETPGSCTFGAIGKQGALIGQSTKPNGDVGDWLVGAIDAVRLWDVPLTDADICASSGRPGC